MDRLEEIEERWMCRFDDAMPPGAWIARQDKLIKEDVPWMIEQLKSWQDGNPAIVQEVEDLRDSIKRAEEERDDLYQWKESAMLVESKWDAQEVARELGIHIGQDIRENIMPKIRALKADLAACREKLARKEQVSDDIIKDLLKERDHKIEELDRYKQRDEVWRGKKEMLENDLAKAWEKLERYERAMGPVVKMKRWMRKIGNWPIAGPERDYTIKNRNSEAWEACKNATRLLDSGKVTESVTKGE